MTILGYILAIIIGLLLGLLGGGGSILSVPVLRYGFDLSAYDATAYSLFVVGVVSIIGTATYLRDKLVDIKVLFSFGVLASVAAFFTRNYFVPKLPEEMLSMGNFTLTRDMFIMVLFASLMLFSAKSMIKDEEVEEQGKPKPFIFSALVGIFVGFITSLVGAGGGFIVVPVLTKFYKMPVKRAIGTSLSIIMLNSLAGFSGQALISENIDWPFLVTFTGAASLGLLGGVYLSNMIPGKTLKPIFGWFVVAMSAFIFIKELVI